MIPAPLKDSSGGRLKGWPGGCFIPPGGPAVPTFRLAGPGEKAAAEVKRGGGGRWTDCKYCYRTTLPLSLHEYIEMRDGSVRTSIMIICSNCGSGLYTKQFLDNAEAAA